MKKLLLLLLGISFLILLSFSSNTLESVVFNRELEIEQEGCPECKAEYMKCIKPIYYVYAKTVEKVADKLKADSITQEDYKKACDEAKLVRQKGEKPCMTEYNKCCLEEARKNQNKKKELGGNSNTIL